MCDELGEFVDWFYRNYSGVLGISQVYVVPLGGFVLAAIHFERGSRGSGDVPVGLTIYGLGDRVEAYCSLPISCTADGRTVRMGDLIQSRVGPSGADLPLVGDLGLEVVCLDGAVAAVERIGCSDVYSRMGQFAVACGLLNKWARVGGDIYSEFREAAGL
ncbi:MAG: hypothetical protein RXR06_08665 [Thermoproteus sp.]